jgi:hypothetical protein
MEALTRQKGREGEGGLTIAALSNAVPAKKRAPLFA